MQIVKYDTSNTLMIIRIRFWTDCTQNCVTCLDGSNCSVCLEGLGKYELSSGQIVCEQFKSCTLSSCQSCYKSQTLEVCARCYPGYKFDSNNDCVSLTGLACTLCKIERKLLNFQKFLRDGESFNRIRCFYNLFISIFQMYYLSLMKF